MSEELSKRVSYLYDLQNGIYTIELLDLKHLLIEYLHRLDSNT